MGKDLKGRELGKGISQRKDGRYYARFTNRFGKRIEYGNSSLQIVKKWMTEEVSKDNLGMNIIDNTITLDQWYEKWLSVYKFGILKPSSRIGYIINYKKHISPVLGKFKISDIKRIQIRKLLNNLEEEGYGFEMKNRIKIMLGDMFDKALIDHFIRENPAKSIKIKRDENKEPRYLSVEEQSVFFNYCKGTFYDNLFVFMVNTGVRPGEAYSMRECDFDFNKDQVNISRTLSYQKFEGDTKKEFHFGTPKTKSSVRTIPLNQIAKIAVMKQIMQKRIISSKYKCAFGEEFEDLIFTSRFNNPLCSQTVIDAIHKSLLEINIMRDSLEQIEDFSPHCFRHTFATRALESGVKPKVLQNLLGHATLQMTMDLYCHVIPQLKEDEMKLVEKYMNKVDDYADSDIEDRYYKRDNDNVIDFLSAI